MLIFYANFRKIRFFPHIYQYFANILNDGSHWHIVCATGSALGGDIMKSQEYRSKALECLESAPWICDRTAKKALIDMALCWLRLADMHDANEGRASDMRELGSQARSLS